MSSIIKFDSEIMKYRAENKKSIVDLLFEKKKKKIVNVQNKKVVLINVIYVNENINLSILKLKCLEQ